MLVFQEAQQISLSNYLSWLANSDRNPPPLAPSAGYEQYPTLPLPLRSKFQPLEEYDFGIVTTNDSRDGSDSGYGASSLQLSMHSRSERKDSNPIHALTSQALDLSTQIHRALEFQDAISRNVNKTGPPGLDIQYWRMEEVNLGFDG